MKLKKVHKNEIQQTSKNVVTFKLTVTSILEILRDKIIIIGKIN